MFDLHEMPGIIQKMDKAPLDIRQIEAFAAVMSAGSITGAARLLGRSQPAVTRQIRELEAEIGYELLHRSGPRISPTRRGVQFHAQVERLLFGLKHIRARAEAIGAAALPAIELACTAALSAGLIPDALAEIDPALLPAQIHIQSLSAEGVVQQVLSHAADFGLASLPVEHPGLEVHWIGEAPCLAALPPDDPLVCQEVVPLRALAERRVITMANPYRLRRRVDEAFASVGTGPRGIIDTNSSLTALALVRRGLGVAIVEPVMASSLELQGVVLRPLDVAIPFLFGAISPVAHPTPPGIAALSEALVKVAARMISGFRLHDLGKPDLLSDLVYGPDDHKEALR
jgi:DNA-binding transcriptional LysR family regulator